MIRSPTEIPKRDPTGTSSRLWKNVLLVIAHPDDECYFFGPILTMLKDKVHYGVHVLCMSMGDHEHLGPLRSQELKDSCGVFGILESRVTLLNHP